MGRKKKIEEVELTDEQKLRDVHNINELSGRYIADFSGDTYNHSLVLAHDWAKGIHTNREGQKYTVHLVDYYPVIKGNKAILVSYNTKLVVEN